MKLKAHKTLLKAARTFRQKNRQYSNNWEMVGKVFVALYPNGITLRTEEDFVLFHWMSWKVGKLTRFVQTRHTHLDSIHDDGVYTFMIETYIQQQKKGRHDPKH
jgi:hypothetical protein